MGLSSSELDRLADDTYKDRRILGSVYCGRCGYNLRTLPHCHQCPECGNAYNARPLKMVGIFVPRDADFPFGDIASTLFCASAALLFGYSAKSPWNAVSFVMGAGFVLLAVVYGVLAYGRFRRFLRTRSIARRIILDERE